MFCTNAEHFLKLRSYRVFESYSDRQYIDFQLAIPKWKLPEAPPRAGFFAMGS